MRTFLASSQEKWKETISYTNSGTDFTIEFSRIDRNILSSQINGQINGQINESEQAVLALLRDNPMLTNAELIKKVGKSQRTITRTLAALKDKELITRVGSNKSGYWKVK